MWKKTDDIYFDSAFGVFVCELRLHDVLFKIADKSLSTKDILLLRLLT